MVVIDGCYSLIDYDTHLTCLRRLDVLFEKQKGCLRPHVAPRYRERKSWNMFVVVGQS